MDFVDDSTRNEYERKNFGRETERVREKKREREIDREEEKK